LSPPNPSVILSQTLNPIDAVWRWLVEIAFPKCQKCKEGDLVPLSDFGSQGAPIHFKAWACTNPECGFNIKIRNGDLYVDEPISSGALHSPRLR
jgi:hypothetical protein